MNLGFVLLNESAIDDSIHNRKWECDRTGVYSAIGYKEIERNENV